MYFKKLFKRKEKTKGTITTAHIKDILESDDIAFSDFHIGANDRVQMTLHMWTEWWKLN